MLLTCRGFVVAALLALLVVPVAAQDEDGLVTAIEVRTDSRSADRRALSDAIEINLGQALDRTLAARTIENLYGLGLGSDIRLSLVPAPEGDGLVAVFEIHSDVRLESVEIAGVRSLSRGELFSVIEARAGERLLEDRLLRSVFSLRDLYDDAGYRDARVRLAVDIDETSRLAAVTFHLDSRERAQVAEVIFDGAVTGLPYSTLLEPLELVPGSDFSRRALREDADRLRRHLQGLGYRRVRVEASRVVEGDGGSARGVEIHHRVFLGPLVEVVFDLPDADDRKRLEQKGMLPFLGEAGLDQGLLQESVQRVRAEYQRRGYYDVSVTAETAVQEALPHTPPSERVGEVEQVTFTVRAGERYRLVGLELEGNTSYADSVLLPLFETAPGRGLGGSGRLVSDAFDADLDNLRAWYALQGFSEAQIGPAEIERRPPQRQGERGELAVVVPILEGPRQLVSGLSLQIGAEGPGALQGRQLPTAAELEAELPLEVGGPFHTQRLEQAEQRIRAVFEAAGFDRALVSSDVDWGTDGQLADVHLEIEPGVRRVVGGVIVRGNLLTRESLIRRSMGLERGQPFHRARLLEAQRALYRLGVFSRVTVEPGPRRLKGDALGLAAGEVSQEVIVRLVEARRWRLSYGASWNSEDGFGGLFAASRSNLFGRGGALQLDTRVNQREERFRLLYVDRRPGRGATTLNYALYRISEELSEFQSERFGLQLEAQRILGGVRASAFFDYRNVDLELGSGIDPDTSVIGLVDRELAEVEIASVTATLSIDRRDDPFEPRRGYSGTVQLEQAFSLFSAKEEFTKLFVQGTGAFDLAPVGVVAASVRVGGIERGGDEAVPISERFFAGGRTTHRAFARDELGFVGETIREGISVGGEGLLLGNLDFRFPIAGAFGGTIFFDTGGVWSEWTDVDPSELRHGAGVGVRYLSPVGPIRLEVGWKLDPDVDESRSVVFLSFGNAF